MNAEPSPRQRARDVTPLTESQGGAQLGPVFDPCHGNIFAEGHWMDMEMHRVPETEMRVVVIVEGISDRIALEALAARRGKDLHAEGVSVVPVGGAHGIGRFLDRLDLGHAKVGLAGLCDAREERQFQHALERAGLGTNLRRADMEELGFYVCDDDLEAELIRAVGAAAVEDVLATHGDIGPFRTLQKQPQWQGRPAEEQLRRFMGSGGRRKIKYARLLVEALDLARVPRPLDGVLAHVARFIAAHDERSS